MQTDPISDFLTRIRNGISAGFTQVRIPMSKQKLAIAELLRKEGYLADVGVDDAGNHKEIVVRLKYDENRECVIKGLKRLSKPGRRLYVSAGDIPKTLDGYGITIVSTSHGILTDKEARKQNIGGEALASIW
ncbi:MAG: 30S ribosomal protein S8 [Myxococcota bacterium]